MDSNIMHTVCNDRFAKYIGAEIVKAEPGYAVVEMKITDNHMNGLNIVQGGAIFTLADFAFAAASNNNGIVTVGVNANISYLKSPEGSRLTAVARELKAGRKICHYDVEVNDGNADLVAKVHFTGYRKK
ncbi:thioesterase [Thermoclostridium stercorarium subsp. thermolacticum DSM 2910]|uniref:Thioesterase n=2 Tax=Thermoclostridium stercorarium TaxID=1510 RepID=A0A1B1YHQ5_THEST|nr:PaaI family thioesterase [Thermoclostridium stercorarium]ANW97768.1 thioesterase [Thermoclostridium stercorarium subsp. thermolacticum DSM 2910]ANX00295.1 thioesterase [Thermoclostridium stercorarium subsp. leptospartum DSM 9219]UZQ85839.1 PaaI family thioesterase [Thermoclostridium stercorarium]